MNSNKKSGAVCISCNQLNTYTTDGECKECYNKNHNITKVNVKCCVCGQKANHLYDGKCWQCDQKTSPTFAEIENRMLKDQGLMKCSVCNIRSTKEPICPRCEFKKTKQFLVDEVYDIVMNKNK